MDLKEKLLTIKNLRTYFFIEPESSTVRPRMYYNDPLLSQFYRNDNMLKNKVPAKAVDDVSFHISRGEIVGIVGESGSGKSVSANSITRLVPDPPGKIVSGEIFFNGINLLNLSYKELKKYRGREIAMIFQEPMTSLNPVMRVNRQIEEVIMAHESISPKCAIDKTSELLKAVGISGTGNISGEYPHKLSGGMRQRVMIAMALACNPSLLIADEPTTALDVTIQAQILELILSLKAQNKISSILLISHNLGVISEMCDRVIIMYGGKIQEEGNVKDVFTLPYHPYSIGLFESVPLLHSNKKLKPIPGNVPNILDHPSGCKFCTRCLKVMDLCREKEPELKEISGGHKVRCHLY